MDNFSVVDSVVVCTDLSGKEPHGQVGVSNVMIFSEPSGVMVNMLTRNARDVGSIHALLSMDPHNTCAMTRIMY